MLNVFICDVRFMTLMRFVVKLKKGNGGWVSVSDLKTGGYINDYEHRQRYSNLRTALKGSLHEKDGKKFIPSRSLPRFIGVMFVFPFKPATSR